MKRFTLAIILLSLSMLTVLTHFEDGFHSLYHQASHTVCHDEVNHHTQTLWSAEACSFYRLMALICTAFSINFFALSLALYLSYSYFRISFYIAESRLSYQLLSLCPRAPPVFSL